MEEETERLLGLIQSQGAEKLREFLQLESSLEQWEDLGVQNEVASYRLHSPETGHAVLKGVGDIPESPETILALITDMSRKGEWDERFVEGRVVASLSERDRLSYQCFSAPSPISQQDFVYLALFRLLEDGSFVTLGFSVQSSLVPEVPGVVRGHIYLTGFLFRRLGPKLTRLTQVVHLDSKDSIPTNVSNQSEKEQTQSISCLRNCLAKKGSD